MADTDSSGHSGFLSAPSPPSRRNEWPLRQLAPRGPEPCPAWLHTPRAQPSPGPEHSTHSCWLKLGKEQNQASLNAMQFHPESMKVLPSLLCLELGQRGSQHEQHILEQAKPSVLLGCGARGPDEVPLDPPESQAVSLSDMLWLGFRFQPADPRLLVCSPSRGAGLRPKGTRQYKSHEYWATGSLSTLCSEQDAKGKAW